MFKIKDRVRDKTYKRLEGYIEDIDTSYAHRHGRVYYKVVFDCEHPTTQLLKYLWYQEKDLELILDKETKDAFKP